MDEIDVIRRMSTQPPDPDKDALHRIALPLAERIDAVTPQHKRRVSRSVTVVLVAASIALAGGALAWALSSGSARDAVSVQCLIRGDDAIIPATTGDPIADCTAYWRRSTGNNPPELVAYDNGVGGITVTAADHAPLPGATAMPSGATQNVPLLAVQQSLDDYVSGLRSGCFDSDTAIGMTQQTLTRYGLADWAVSSDADPAPTSTASPGSRNSDTCFDTSVLDPATRTVQLRGTHGGGVSPDAQYMELAVKLRTIAQDCLSLDAATAQVRSAADGLGLSEASNGYELTQIPEKGARCTTVVENVGGTIFLILRGPTG
jgi:hypothetical protein